MYAYYSVYVCLRLYTCVCVRARPLALFNYLQGANAKFVVLGVIFYIFIENRISLNAFVANNNNNNNNKRILLEKKHCITYYNHKIAVILYTLQNGLFRG
jgi:hypothetical protein